MGGGEVKKVAVIMAGGTGIRLWPRSTEKRPKQFIHLIGDGTMIQDTFDRLSKKFLTEDIYVTTTSEMAAVVSEQLPQLPQENIIIEPFARNTAPCIALSAILLGRKYSPDTILAVFPADHVIFNNEEFYDSLETSFDAASDLKGIVTIGLHPTRPETGFGYVQVKKDFHGKLGELYDRGVRYSTTFAEKPDAATAKRFIDSGDFLWNSGIFIWRFDTFWQSIQKYWPEDAELFNVLRDHIGKDTFKENLEQTYRQISSLSIDYAILEKADNVFVVQSSFRWSDLGNWDEIYRLMMKDARNNVFEGDVIPINSTNCFVSSNGKLISIIGLNDLIVIDSDDALLICRRKQSDDVKEVIDFLRRKQINRFL